MPSVATVIEIAKICPALVIRDIELGIETDLELANKIRMEQQLLEWASDNSYDGIDIDAFSDYVYGMCGGYAYEAEGILGSGGGIVVNPSTNTANLVSYRSQYTIGDVDAPILNGETSYSFSIGVGSILLDNTVQIVLDGTVIPRSDSSRISYTFTYAAGAFTITFNQGVITGQQYIVTFEYLTT